MNTLTVTHITRGRSESTEKIVEGVYTDPSLKRDLRAEYALYDMMEPAASRRVRLAAEEAQWAARSGPVIVKRPARTA